VHIAERHALLGEHRAGPLAALAGGGLGVVLVALAEQQMTDLARRDAQDELRLGAWSRTPRTTFSSSGLVTV
jgi:hypothetical protein